AVRPHAHPTRGATARVAARPRLHRSRPGHVDFGATVWDGPWDARRQRAAGREPAWHVAGRALSRMDAPHPLAAEAPAPAAASEHRRELPALALAALGVVYGDIGTSPLYAIKECFVPHRGLPPTPANVLGILSLVLWSLIVVIVLKYLTFIMEADNRGEGGILALMALLGPAAGRTPALISLGLFGAALLYGDGVITPAISVLSAMEGLEVAAPRLADYIVPATVVILGALFLVQRRGTAGVGTVFGPATLVWFVSIAAVGLPQIVQQPGILAAVNPLHAVRFLGTHGFHGFLVLGAVV